MSEQLEKRLSKIRFQLLERNPYFLVDYDELVSQTDRDSEEYREKEKIFCKKWSVGGVDIRSLHHVRLKDPVTIVKDADKSGRLTLEIDLRYSKEKIQDELKKVVDDWHRDYNAIRKERWLDLFTDDRMFDLIDGWTPTLKKEFEQFYKEMSKYDKPELEWGRQQAPEFYELCIKVYDLKVKKINPMHKLRWN